MTVSVIVSSYNQVMTLPLALAAMAGQKEHPAEVIIADDGSEDGTAEWFECRKEDYPFPLHMTTGPHKGYGLAVSENRAARAAVGDLLLFTNADVIHAPSSVLFHSTIPDARVAGGVIREIRRELAEQLMPADVEDWDSLAALMDGNLTETTNFEFVIRLPELNIYGVWGGNFSVPRELFLSVGGFDEEYLGHYGGEEADLIQRLRGKGARVVWADGSHAFHLEHSKKPYHHEASGIIKYRLKYMV